MNGYLGNIGNTSIRVTKQYLNEDDEYNFNIHLMEDSEDGNPQNERFAICRCPQMDWFARYGYTDEELERAFNYVMNKTDNGKLVDLEEV